MGEGSVRPPGGGVGWGDQACARRTCGSQRAEGVAWALQGLPFCPPLPCPRSPDGKEVCSGPQAPGRSPSGPGEQPLTLSVAGGVGSGSGRSPRSERCAHREAAGSPAGLFHPHRRPTGSHTRGSPETKSLPGEPLSQLGGPRGRARGRGCGRARGSGIRDAGRARAQAPRPPAPQDPAPPSPPLPPRAPRTHLGLLQGAEAQLVHEGVPPRGRQARRVAGPRAGGGGGDDPRPARPQPHGRRPPGGEQDAAGPGRGRGCAAAGAGRAQARARRGVTWAGEGRGEGRRRGLHRAPPPARGKGGPARAAQPPPAGADAGLGGPGGPGGAPRSGRRPRGWAGP